LPRDMEDAGQEKGDDEEGVRIHSLEIVKSDCPIRDHHATRTEHGPCRAVRVPSFLFLRVCRVGNGKSLSAKWRCATVRHGETVSAYPESNSAPPKQTSEVPVGIA